MTGPNQSADHYFTADPSTPFKREAFTATVWGHKLSLVSGSGVYSRGHLDIGTASLFKEARPPAAGRILDLGCGYGVIGLAIASAVPGVSVHGVDVNERALLLARENIASLGLAKQMTVSLPSDTPAGEFDEIWSNPPIRIGKSALHEILLTWLPRLRPGGRAVMVVGKNLGADSLQRWLIDQGYPTERTASSKGFRILQSTRPA